MNDKLMIDRTLLEQALDALLHRRSGSDQVQRIDAAITDLCAALAQQPEPAQEPVAWMVEGSLYASKEVAQKMGGNAYTLQALYIAPPQRPPLTDEEIRDAVQEADLDWQAGWTLAEHEPNRFTTLARAIERKVRGEKE